MSLISEAYPAPKYAMNDHTGTAVRSGTFVRVLAALALAGLALIIGNWLFSVSSALTFQDDAAQTVSTATHWQRGDGLRTSVLYYDSQLEQSAPARQTVWPPAVPVMTAVVASLTGLPVAQSLLVLLFAGHLASAALAGYALSLALGGSASFADNRGANATSQSVGSPVHWLGFAVTAAWLVSVPSLLNVSRGLAEPIFQAGGMAALVCLILAVKSTREQAASSWLLAAGLAVSVAILSRYQAIALIGPLALAAMLTGAPQARWMTRLRSACLASAVPLAVTAALLSRNWLITSSLTGGAQAERGQSLAEIAARITWLPQAWQLPGLLLLIASCLAALLIAGVIWVRSFDTCRQRPAWTCAKLKMALVFCLTAYSANVILLLGLSLTSTVYVFEMRYLTVNALFLIVPAVAASYLSLTRLSQTRSGAFRITFLSVCIVVLAALQFLAFTPSMAARVAKAPSVEVDRILHAHQIDGISAAQWLRNRLPSGSAVLSSHAHSLSLALTGLGRHSTTVVGIPLPVYTNKAWGEQEIRAMTTRHSVHYLIAFRELPTWVYKDPVNSLVEQADQLTWVKPIVQSSELFIGAIFRR